MSTYHKLYTDMTVDMHQTCKYLRSCLYDGREHAMADRAAAKSQPILSPLAFLGGPREARDHASLRSDQTPRFARPKRLASLGHSASLRSAGLSSACGCAPQALTSCCADSPGSRSDVLSLDACRSKCMVDAGNTVFVERKHSEGTPGRPKYECTKRWKYLFCRAECSRSQKPLYS